ncbi:NAD kinase [Indibacter alkaliphilus LW1]|jgi:NAD+ kinase|uniref:NAD kinase n=1 Tax=Indibacter alkaliphilus (strain CCUG 57479 / KCTC 22604 / LW1) TaxID=1189612 RepID=S2DGE3_INDAL|nr:NAD kinase [Indibacter alkaliphilus]EOZ97999.1 NAD kinase [Indibacter alkaliphilus LW1]
MNICIHGINLQDEFIPYIEQLITSISDRGARVFFTETFNKSLLRSKSKFKNKFPVVDKNHASELNFMLSVGGDGTLLDTVTYIGSEEIPVLGINTGRLGFLATVAKGNIAAAMEDLFNGDFTIESRALVEMEASRPVFNGANFALNEFTIHKRDTSSMITVHTYIDGQYLNSYWADGLIVATPTGSTGYSLSCGGPLITPGARNFVITPVSPHNLNVRPIVVSDESEISFRIEGRSEKFLISLDSRSTAIDASIELKVRKAPFAAKLVKFSKYNYFDTLRQKLNWGFDMRN